LSKNAFSADNQQGRIKYEGMHLYVISGTTAKYGIDMPIDHMFWADSDEMAIKHVQEIQDHNDFMNATLKRVDGEKYTEIKSVYFRRQF
jgi:hypothetical protein